MFLDYLCFKQREPMTKPKAKAVAAASIPETPTVSAENMEQPGPSLLINEVVANTFMTEIERLPAPPEIKVEAARASLVSKLAKSITSAKRVPTTPKLSAAESHHTTPAEKAEVISKITLNANSFEKLLGDYLKPNKEAFLAGLPKRTLIELETTLKSLEYARSASNLTNQMRHLTYVTTQAIEMGTRKMGLKTQGYASAIRAQDDEIRLILKEIAMERAAALHAMQRPELRLALILSTTLLALDSQNRLAEQTQKSMNPDTAKAFQDL